MNIEIGRRSLVALLVVILIGMIFKASFFQEESEVYLFPMIVASTMLVLSLISLIREALDLSVDDYQPFPFIRQLPAILVMIATVSLVETLGIYTSAFLSLLIITNWYSPEEDRTRRIKSSVLFSLGFTAFMYLLFTLMLNVQLPRGMLI